MDIENCKNNWHFTNDLSCVVLYSLQFLDAVAWSAVEHSVAVVDPKFRDFVIYCRLHWVQSYNVHKDFRTDSTDSPGCLPTLVSLSVFAFYFFFFPFLVVGFLW